MIGDPAAWLRRYRSLDQRVMALVAMIWPGCIADLPVQPDEDTITIQLVDALSRDPGARRLGVIEYQFEPFGHRPDGIAYSKGKIDMAVLLDRTRRQYLAYECKRLNVIRGGKRRSLATQYVMEGLRRFITGQYAEGLPVGCMLGYVLDGDVPFARTKVIEALRRKKQEVGFVGVSRPTVTPPSAEEFVSDHVRCSCTTIEIRHTMLPF